MKNTAQAVRSSLDEFVRRTSEELGIPAEAVALEAFYRLQRHPTWGRNATLTQKNASYKHWNGVCHRCKRAVERTEAKFHHLTRGIPDQHSPQNLVPEHPICHDDEHRVRNGSLSKGSPQARNLKDAATNDA